MMDAPGAFLLGFPALFSIVNPPAVAFIFNEVTSDLTHADRVYLAGRVAAFSFVVMIFSLWAGAYVLSFFGISIAALRLAGGAVVALRAWEMLMAPERQEARKTEQAGAKATDIAGIAFFPLTMPFTTGPGTISVAVALGSGRPSGWQDLPGFFIGMSAAAAGVALLIWICYRWADRMAAWVGPSGRRTISRLSAFLLVCIGVQIALAGVEEEVHRILAAVG